MTGSQSWTSWLATLPALGYDRDWIRRNEPMLRRTFESTGGAPMAQCPEPAPKRYDRWSEL